MDLSLLLPSAATLAAMWLVGKAGWRSWGWLAAIFAELSWVWYVFTADAYGMIPLIVVLIAIYLVNLVRALRSDAVEVDPEAFAGELGELYDAELDSLADTDEPEVLPEPWRSVPEVFLVSVAALHMASNPEQLYAAQRDSERVMGIAYSVVSKGLQRPLSLVLDDRSRCVLADGHHRLVMAKELGWEKLPVTIQHSPRITGYGIPVETLLRWAAA